MNNCERKDSILLIIYCRLFGGLCMHIFLYFYDMLDLLFYIFVVFLSL